MKGESEMKKIIRGLMYNTETAKEMGWWSNGYSCNDFSYEEEHLYKKRTGEFFIYGWGGPKSKYARATGLNSGLVTVTSSLSAMKKPRNGQKKSSLLMSMRASSVK